MHRDDSPLRLIQPAAGLSVPHGTAPAGTEYIGNIIFGRAPDGEVKMEFRLPSGVAMDPSNGFHVFGTFIVANAQQLMSVCRDAHQQARAAQRAQNDETVARTILPGA